MTLELRFKIPGQAERSVPLDQPTIRIGALLSNQVVLRAPGVDPIHALIEETDDGSWLVTDLGSATGVKVNGKLVDVEQKVSDGDAVTVGSVVMNVAQAAGEKTEEDAPGVAQPEIAPYPQQEDQGEQSEDRRGVVGAEQAAPADGGGRGTVRVPTEDGAERRAGTDTFARSADSDTQAGAKKERKHDVLFSPRGARPGGDVLEVVAYWGDTVLDVDLFHPKYKGFEEVTIGDPTKSHLIAAGKSQFAMHKLATVRENGYKLNMRDGMKARLRKAGKVEKVDGQGSHKMGRRDIAHIKYGAVRYFMMFVRPPALNLPKTGPTDPLFVGLMSVAMLLYILFVPFAWVHNPAPEDEEKDDIWSVVQVPEKKKKIERAEVQKKKKKKKPVDLAKKKKEPEKRKPPEPKKPVKPAKPIEKEKVKQPEPVKKPVKTEKPTKVLTKTKANKKQNNLNKKRKQKVKKSQAKKTANTSGRNANRKKKNVKRPSGKGMPSTGADKPDFKLAGSKNNRPKGKAGGAKGSGMNQRGGARKGKSTASHKGVEGVKNKKASGPNLSKLGVGVGKIVNKKGAGAVRTKFKNSAGGAGGGAGSANKTYGLGGVGKSKSLGVAGSGKAANNFGSGSGGFGSGAGGKGGRGGAGLKGKFGGGAGGGGKGRANVTVPPSDPVVSGGLTPQEIMAVIRANLNQIRHCYEQTLQRSPNAAGKIKVKFVVNTNGRAGQVSVMNSTISDPRMRGCVTGKIRRWKFPKPRGGKPVTVNYPFVFNPL